MVASKGTHTFISTGMSTYDDIDTTVNIFRDARCSFELMHTVLNHPMLDKDANLRLITSLKELYECEVVTLVMKQALLYHMCLLP